MKMMAKSLLLLSAAFLLTVASPVENEFREIESRQETVNYRLGEEIFPTKYELYITPYFVDEGDDKKAFTFTGNVKISFLANMEVNAIVLHQNDLVITTYSILNEKSQTIIGNGTYNSTQYNTITDKWTIPLADKLSLTASYVLEVDYTGYMRDDMHGFYRTYYKKNNESIWMASTQFEQTEARRAFPCFDEPRFKTSFKLTLLIPLTMNAISNTAGTREGIQGKSQYTFAETPQMSTYLLAFIVSNHDAKKNNNFGVYARPEAYNQTDFSLKAGVELLEKFDQYLEIKYDTLGIAKLDMAAIPHFSAGAMENWGLLTYRESNILQYPNDTPSLSEQRIVAVIAHEQAHQWFGDSVTCKWWSETWLNEAFGRYFQFFGTAWLYPDWDLEEQFIVENHQQSMQLDSTDDTHPMTDPSVSTKAQASAIFDNISYNKAASIMRMLRNTIGDVPFRNTLTRYLKDNQNKSVEPVDLFDAIDLITPIAPGPTEYKISDIFKPWTTQSGFPLVTVKRENKTLKLTQKRFMRSGETTKTEKWTIPITFGIDYDDYSDTTPKFYMNESATGESTFDLPKTPEKYYLLNNRQTGYYRVNYDEENWSKIKEALFKENFDKIEPYNRAQIVDDLFQLARAGIVKYSNAIDIIRYIKKEKHYAPWLSAISHGLTFLSQRVSGEKDQKTFAWFVKDLMDDIYKHLKFLPVQTERRTDIYNRANILSWLCKYGHEECINLSKEHFNYLIVNETKVLKDQRSVVYCNGVREGNATHFNTLYDLHAKTDISIEQLTLLSGMSCTKDPELVEKYLDLITLTELIRPQDRAATINNMINSNPDGPQWLYNYITKNHTRWSSKLGNLNTLTTVAGRFTTQAQFDTYAAFLSSKQTELGDFHTSLNNGLTAAKANLVWDTKYMKEFMEHLNKLNDDTSPANAKVVSIFVTLISLIALYISN